MYPMDCGTAWESSLGGDIEKCEKRVSQSVTLKIVNLASNFPHSPGAIADICDKVKFVYSFGNK